MPQICNLIYKKCLGCRNIEMKQSYLLVWMEIKIYKAKIKVMTAWKGKKINMHTKR